MLSDSRNDVGQELYPSVIREMIRHENDVTNHRIMWLLIGQGFIANAYVSVAGAGTSSSAMLFLVGILVALSAFVMLYKSYLARGYLNSLGHQAKRGTLNEEHLPLVGWPARRQRMWWKDVWVCPWIARVGDLLEAWILLPWLFVFTWTTALVRYQLGLETIVSLILGIVLATLTLPVFCITFVWLHSRDDEGSSEP